MGIEIPSELKPVAALVVAKWPESDETGLQGAADRWNQMGDLLDKLNDDGDDIVKILLAHTEGKTHDSIEQFWKKVGGKDGALKQLADLCHELGQVLQIMAYLVLAVKLFIISMLIYLAVQLAIAAAGAVETLGASVAEGAAQEVAVRAAINKALSKLLENITVWTVVKGAAIGGSLGALKEFGLQELEIKLGVRNGLDVGDIATESARGAITGAIASPVSATSTKLLKESGISTGTKAGDWLLNNRIGHEVGSKTVGSVWDETSITDRLTGKIEDKLREKIVDELSKPQTTGQNPSSLDLPPQ
ncbi:hypothetical protein [Nocardia arthritidis]|uniref:Outer membrane channel protein CpnT-like N-terminal domain-containing protein n=1 Tax=Nocardia arthritidis TaxID=228602 RepID=A0A6G9Y7I3_9NOCA|nr:hypothetical protein [Nocardia arthritidis]QIS09169.1 hypothetical protein F5544_06290 [Nocardia arthritidis]